MSRILAADGGSPAFPEGPPAWPLPDDRVREVLAACADDGSWGRYLGEHVERLESELSRHHASAAAFTCCSGTFAVELALRSLRLPAGSQVVLAAYDFPGNFRAIEDAGLVPVLADIDPRSWCLDPASMEQARGPKTSAVIVSHLHGGLAPMRTMRDWADHWGIALVEDTCQAPGAIVDGRPAGTWGHVGVLSFGGSKLVSAGRGGALLSGQSEIVQRARIYCERGNHAFPLSELQAAILLPQWQQLADRNAQRAAAVHRLLDCGPLPGLTPLACDRPPVNRAFYKLAWLVEHEPESNRTREEFLRRVQAEGVAMHEGFRGFLRRGTRRCRRPVPLHNAERAARDTVILHHPILLADKPTIDVLAEVLDGVARSFPDATAC